MVREALIFHPGAVNEAVFIQLAIPSAIAAGLIVFVVDHGRQRLRREYFGEKEVLEFGAFNDKDCGGPLGG